MRASLFSQIHEIVFHGKGGYTWETVYNMPRWLRLFTFDKIKKFYEEEAEAYNKSTSNKNTLVDSHGNINKQAAKVAKPPVAPKSKPSFKY